MYIFSIIALYNSKLLNTKNVLSTSFGSNQAPIVTNKSILKKYSDSGKINSYVTNKINLFITLIFIICIVYVLILGIDLQYCYVKIIIIKEV